MQTLKGMTVLVTRPEPGATRLAKAIEDAGGNAIVMPVMEIAGVKNSFTSIKPNTSHCDIAIFVSCNAVQYALQEDSQLLRDCLASAEVAAIGSSTADCLREHGFEPDILPVASSYTSEALLSCDKLQKVEGKNVLIFRGVGGRNKLAEELIARGANVNYCEVYKRELATKFDNQKLAVFTKPKHVIFCSSVEVIRNLLQLAGKSYGTIVKETPLIVVSNRMREEALKLGFTAELIVSDNATDQAVVTCLQRWSGAKES